jgi:hypothetical protein
LAVFYQFPQIALIFLVVFKTSILAVASEQVAFDSLLFIGDLLGVPVKDVKRCFCACVCIYNTSRRP